MARIACTIGQDANGNWHCLALPDTDPKKQKDALKDCIVAGGLYGKGKDAIQLVNASVLSTTGRIKRAKFKPEKVERKAKAEKKA